MTRASGISISISKTLLVFVFPLSSASFCCSAQAEFDQIINVVRASQVSEIGSNTQLNLFNLGRLYQNLNAGNSDGSSVNIEVNILGGYSFGWITANSGTTVNVHVGDAGSYLTANSGSVVNVFGGSVGLSMRANDGSLVNLYGGRVGNSFSASPSSTVNMSGGILGERLRTAGSTNFSGGAIGGRMTILGTGEFNMTGGSIGSSVDILGTLNTSGGTLGDAVQVHEGANLNLYGADFLLGNAFVRGLRLEGDSQIIEVPPGEVLSGTLADGTPFALSSSDLDQMTEGTVTLHLTDVPEIVPGVLFGDSDLRGIRNQQLLLIETGIDLGNDFNAGRGSTIAMSGGSIGSNLELVGANFILTGGTLGNDADAFVGSNLAITGGKVSQGFQAHAGSLVNLSAGEVGTDAEILPGAVFNSSGGHIRDRFSLNPGAVWNYSGGAVGDSLTIASGATTIITGGEFYLDGLPIENLEVSGQTVEVAMGTTSTLSGVLSDGTPFILSSEDADELVGTTLKLKRGILPLVSTKEVVVSEDSNLLGIRGGQTLVVNDEGKLIDDFTAGKGSVTVVQGGSVGVNFEAEDAQVLVTAGSVGRYFDAFKGSSITIEGGSVGGNFHAHAGSSIVVSGGTIEGGFHANGSSVTVTGGEIGPSAIVEKGSDLLVTNGVIGSNLVVADGSRAVLSGGVIGWRAEAQSGGIVDIAGANVGTFFRVRNDGLLNISGGAIGDNLVAEPGASANLYGGDYRINGQPIEELNNVGDSLNIVLAGQDILTGTLSDGTPFVFSRMDRGPDPNPGRIRDSSSAAAAVVETGDLFSPGTLTLHRTAVLTAQAGIQIATDTSPLGVRSSQVMIVPSGTSLSSNFNAGPGSTVVVNGGTVPFNFEATGATVLLSDGEIGSYMDAFAGSTVSITGGRIGRMFDAFDSTVAMSEGWIEENFAAHNSTINVTGGYIDNDFVLNNSELVTSGGSLNRLVATQNSDISISSEAWLGNVNLQKGADLQMDGGRISYLQIDGGQAAIAGGRIDLTYIESGELHLFGRQFWIDGLDISTLLSLDKPYVITDRDVQLTATLADGSQVVVELFDSYGSDVTVTATLGTDITGDFNIDGNINGHDFLAWQHGNSPHPLSASDLTAWQEVFSSNVPALLERSFSLIPEPSACTLALATLCFLSMPRRKQHEVFSCADQSERTVWLQSKTFSTRFWPPTPLK